MCWHDLHKTECETNREKRLRHSSISVRLSASHSLPCLATRITAHHSCHASHWALDKGALPIAIAGSPAVSRNVECEPARTVRACVLARDARVMRTCAALARMHVHLGTPRETSCLVTSPVWPALRTLIWPNLRASPPNLTAQTSPSQDLSHTPTPYGYGAWEIPTSRHTLVKLDMPSGRTGERARARRVHISAGQSLNQHSRPHMPHPA
jgi:hypothetical protein